MPVGSDDAQRELFVLGLLRRRQCSAYSIFRAMRDHVPLYRGFKRGNLYHFVDKLVAAGLLEQEPGVAKRGPRETKALYGLTGTGEVRFHELLRQVILDEQASEPALEIALVLLGQLSRVQAKQLLTERANVVMQHERRLSRILGDIGQRAGAGYISQSHTLHRLRSEKQFILETIALLEDPKWQPDWILDDGPIEDSSRIL
jgi:DNA-binding PadR family transcriptional regulator